jgi:hypothetical protein
MRSYAHATTRRNYVVDGFMTINGDDNEIWTDCVLEDCSAPNIFKFYVSGYNKLDGIYYLNCDGDDYVLTKKDEDNGKEYVIDPANYEVDEDRFDGASDDPLWEVLGYGSEEETEEETDSEEEDE